MAVTLGLAVGLLLAGCTTGTEEDSGGGKQEEKIQVGAMMYARDLEFWQLIEAGMRDKARERGVPIHVEISNRQLATEAKAVDTMYARGDNVLVIAPFDLDASTATLKKARERGMTIVQYDNRVNDPSFENFVGVDQKQLGTAVGKVAKEYIDKELGGKAEIALLTGDTEPNGPPRKKAFLAQMPGIEPVTTAEAVGSPEAGARAFETVMQARPNLDLVFAWNGAAMQGSVAAAKRLNSDVKIIGIDMSQQVANAMLAKNSPVIAVGDQNAYQVGASAVGTAVDIAQGKQPKADKRVEPVIYRTDDPAGVQKFLDELRKASK